MLRLMLLRHAKSNAVAGLPDPDRPLTDRGFDQAALVGRYLLAQQLQPELVIVSSAVRTQQTWQQVSAAFSGTVQASTERRIYEASVGDIIEVLHGIDSKAQTVLMIGHNPGLALTTQYFCGEDENDALARLQAGFPPASLTVTDFNVDAWSEIAEGAGRLLRFETIDTMIGS
ncbi:phosphoglycerate mutase [Advenella kashmirensis W13003]|uniref:Phosphoglycerate mutase n=1 Tax=Advenella kashmirensis W13003 TaxID=1424334 RepID=V8QXN7_9BURK|nr:histidine phosphatase family protein [Advenella kashmirensis]ETF04113.1 phosphoglycerate mutase [Advenella kashmirensis W13003]